jgi:LmbE family N-acetylglucosaminyl deacetylase
MTDFGKRILLLVPHPDDEVVASGAAIARARAQGARVYALYLSHGCLARKTLWPWQRHMYGRMVAKRWMEARKAAEFLGLTVVGEVPARAARQIWPQLPAVMEDVRAAIRQCAPDQIWAPAYEGGNPDHDGLNALASRIPEIPVLEFSEYHFAGKRGHSNAFIDSSNATVLTLTPDEQAMKRDALAIYQSEKGNLNYIDVQQESFRPLAPYDYSKPPHPGTLWYAQYQWVPFRHPRVDFTTPGEVSATIGAFLKNG